MNSEILKNHSDLPFSQISMNVTQPGQTVPSMGTVKMQLQVTSASVEMDTSTMGETLDGCQGEFVFPAVSA